MDYKYYERKINDVIMKCPIEAGVEILVYNLLDSVIDSTQTSIVDINSLWKDRDERLQTEGGIPDIAVLSADFEYRTDKGKVYGFVEVKATNSSLPLDGQIEGHKKGTAHCIYTNGLVWKYFKDGEPEWEEVLACYDNQECRKMVEPKKISIDSGKFGNLVEELSKISWY